jgi:transcriptional regulator with XRE-family HTH domain
MLSGEKLAKYRRVRGLSQSEVAERMGVTPNYISIMENGRQDIPTHIYDKWIDALNGKLIADEVKNLENEVKGETKDTKPTVKTRNTRKKR